MHLLPSFVYNMHQDTKSARLIAVCKRTLNVVVFVEYIADLEIFDCRSFCLQL